MSPRAWGAMLLVAVCAAAAPAAGALGTGQVTYLVGGSAYVDVGALDGLAGGDTLDVVRGAGIRGRLVAREVAPRRAACDTLARPGGGPIAVGDAVRFTPHAVAAATPAPAESAAGGGAIAGPGVAATGADIAGVGATPPAARGGTPAARRRAGVRGRIGVSAWSVDAADGNSFVEPATDAWLDARGLGGGVLDAVLDVRARGLAPASGSFVARQPFFARVHRAAVTWHDARSSRLLTLGRQFAPNFASVSLFDGLVARHVGRQFGGGLLVGAQPRVERLEPSLDLLQAGAFVEAHSPPGRASRWSATLGGVTSWQGGETNRDFVFLQGAWQGHGVALLLAQEADIARGWREAFLPGTISLTSTFASARVQVRPGLEARAGYDGRRSVPLWRDRETPETGFDDTLREGAWFGASATPARDVRLDADVRQRFGAARVRTTTWGGGFAVALPGARRAHVRGRGALADGETLRTTLLVGGVDCDLGRALSLGVGGGVRTAEDSATGFDESIPWWSLDGDCAIAAGWSVGGSFEHEGGDPGAVNLGRLGVSWRF